MSGTPLLGAQIATLLLLLGIFVGLVAWLFRPGARQAARRHAEIPFREAPPRTTEDAHRGPGGGSPA